MPMLPLMGFANTPSQMTTTSDDDDDKNDADGMLGVPYLVGLYLTLIAVLQHLPPTCPSSVSLPPNMICSVPTVRCTTLPLHRTTVFPATTMGED